MDFTHYNKNEINQFIDDNISIINTNINNFTAKNIIKKIGNENYNKVNVSSTEIEQILSERFNKIVSNLDEKKSLLDEIESLKVNTKGEFENMLLTISNKLKVNKKDLFSFYKYVVNEKMKFKFEKIGRKKYAKQIVDKIYSDFKIKPNEQYITYDDITTLISSYLSLSFNGGFSKNVLFNESGVKNANEGDSAQFLFVSRAILAGFNCSNVDLRSSKYDAVIDYDGVILRVQVKGKDKDGGGIPLNGRARGGQGNNPDSEKNKAQFVRENDCDLYVNIVKKTGACYLLPTYETEKYVKEAISQNKSTATFPAECAQKYLENWNVVFDIVKRKKEK